MSNTDNEPLGSSDAAAKILADAQAALEKANECANAVSALLAQMEAIKAKGDIVFVGLSEKLESIGAIATQANAAKTQINDVQAVIATKSDHIQKAQEHADKVRGDLDRLLTAATQQATEAEGLKSRAQSSADTSAQLLANIQASKVAVEVESDAIKKLRDSSTEATKSTEAIAKIAKDAEERVTKYEQQLAGLHDSSVTQLEVIEGLLPGATSAGLAHAFDDRRKTFVEPSKRWQWLFIGSVSLLVVLSITGLWQVSHSDGVLTYEKLLLVWLSRLPIAGALLWLALHASRESALAKRLEEDYGYKATVASSFQGFHKQMTEIGAAAVPNSPVAKLCDDTLTTIAAPPGRIYDKHALTVKPTDELAAAAKNLTDTAKALKA